jgi:hypothetical protein
MQIDIIDIPWIKTLAGLSLRHDPAQSYGDEIRVGLGPVWEAVRGSQVATTGINHVWYGAQDEIFCAVECSPEPVAVPGLEFRRIELGHYAYCRLVGPYELIPEAYQAMRTEAERLGLQLTLPGLEIYGDWNDDPQKLVTENLWTVAQK